MSEALPTFGVGAVVALMGIRGFTATKSIPSLLAGLGFGTLFGVGGYLIQDPATSASGRTIALATSLTLAGVMGSRFARTRKLYPAGVLAAVGAGSSAWHGYSVFVRVEHQVADALHSAKETGKHEVEKIERKLSGKD